MPDETSALQNAMARRAALTAEIEEIDRFLNLFRRFSNASSATTIGFSTTSAEIPVGSDESKVFPQGSSVIGGRSTRGISQHEFVNIVRKILIANGRPMTAAQIGAKFHNMERSVGGVDEARNLTTKLWRAQREITKIAGAGYWPRDIPCEAVSYAPHNASASDQPDTEISAEDVSGDSRASDPNS